MSAVPYAEVIGDPISHSKSPVIHKFWLQKLGLDYDYRRTHVTAAELPGYLAQRLADPDWCGCNVTIPHKQAVLDHVGEQTDVVKTLGAANCITRIGRAEPRLRAENSDWSGFLAPIRAWAEREVGTKIAYVIGTGGAAAAISYALDRAGFTVVSIARDMDKASALRARLGLFDEDLVSPLSAWASGGGMQPKDWGDRSDRIDLLVNTTPLGMRGYPELAIELDALPEDMLVYDIVYAPLETELLRRARLRGMPTVDGLEMLVGQAALAFELFFAEKPPRQFDGELRELLLS